MTFNTQIYTPCLEVRLPNDEEKELIWSNSQTASSVLVSDHKGFRGCEAESIVTFVNQEDKFNNHILVEILTRAVVHLTLLVLPCKSKDTSIKKGSLRHVIHLWEKNQAVISAKSEHYVTEKCNSIDYEEFKRDYENLPRLENIEK